jgi:hypothetical protein
LGLGDAASPFSIGLRSPLAEFHTYTHTTAPLIMPFRQLPASDAQRLAALTAAHTKWNSTAAADRVLTTAHFATLDLADPNSLHSVFKRDIEEAGSALSAQSGVTDEATSRSVPSFRSAPTSSRSSTSPSPAAPSRAATAPITASMSPAPIPRP